jgi:NADP-dependent 3-hydroxy acid dehydrogenase YdfG
MINNAGLMQLGPIEKQDPVEWQHMLDTNVLGVLNGCRVALDSMLSRQSGTIINVSSVAGRKTFPNHAAYVGTKFAVHGITENIRSEVAGRNVRVSVIAPGAVETELLSHTSSADVIASYEDWKHSIGGALDPESVVRAIRYVYDQPQSVCVREVVLANTLQVD